MIVATYFEKLDAFDQEDHQELVKLWQRVWTARGYEAVVLDRELAMEHPMAGELLEAVAKFPTVNDRAYETVCYLRWCAFARLAKLQKQLIVVMDYDVFPTVKWKPELFVQDVPGVILSPVCFGHMPSCIQLDGTSAELLVNLILWHQPDIACRHTSDMTILRAYKRQFAARHDLLCYGQPGWRTKPFVHFGNWFMPPGPRTPLIASLLDENLLVCV